MSFTSFLSKIFGNKSQRDLKEIMPIVNKIKALGPDMERLSNDELRDAITKVRQSIANSTAQYENTNAELRAKVEELPFDERQPIWDEIDNNEKKNKLNNAIDKVRKKYGYSSIVPLTTKNKLINSDVLHLHSDVDEEI